MPSGVAQGVQHLRPHGRVALAVLGQPGRVDLECEAHPTHESSTVELRGCGSESLWSWVAGADRRPVGPDPTRSEAELVDVAGIERERVPQQYGSVLAHRELTELARLELVALLAGDDAGGEGGTGVRRQVTEVGRVPQRERLDRAVLDVGPHLVRGAETGQLDLALVRRPRQVAGRG